ncbi:MAG: NUDIX hydrolase [Betaproteobacteria bacterium]|nr:NUDIX hydrolase [Betaproteobacteria bacterium]
MKTADAHLIEHFVSSEPRLSGGYLTVVRDTVCLPDGSHATREYVRHQGAVAVVPLLDDGRIVMVRQYRHAVGQVLVEFPAGKLDPGESVLQCAIRELREETGYEAAQWARAGVFHNAAAYSTEKMEIWFARGLKPGAQRLDPGEFLEVQAMPVSSLDQLAQRGELSDMKTMIGLQWLQKWLSGSWPLEWVHPASA